MRSKKIGFVSELVSCRFAGPQLAMFNVRRTGMSAPHWSLAYAFDLGQSFGLAVVADFDYAGRD
jgi:hypothetical protein